MRNRAERMVSRGRGEQEGIGRSGLDQVGLDLIGASQVPLNISVATSTKVAVQIFKHSSIDTMLSARLKFSGMEMLDVDSWDNDVEFARPRTAHLGL